MITYEQIQKANDSIKTTDIKGKEYAEVNQRIKAFRQVFANGSILTELLSINNGMCIMKATVKDEEGNVLATGHAYEKEDSTFINKTSYIENCETSAVGRALGLCGFGIDTSVASYEEVANAIENQKPKTRATSEVKKQVDKPVNETKDEPITYEKALKMSFTNKAGKEITLGSLNPNELTRLTQNESEEFEELRKGAWVILKKMIANEND